MYDHVDTFWSMIFKIIFEELYFSYRNIYVRREYILLIIEESRQHPLNNVSINLNWKKILK